MQQEQAQRLFEAGGFFILPLDKRGTEFGIDGSLWAVKQDSFAVSDAPLSLAPYFMVQRLREVDDDENGVYQTDVATLRYCLSFSTNDCIRTIGNQIPPTWFSSFRLLSTTLNGLLRSRRITSISISYSLRRRNHHPTWSISIFQT